jgi:hypothetical protein
MLGQENFPKNQQQKKCSVLFLINTNFGTKTFAMRGGIFPQKSTAKKMLYSKIVIPECFYRVSPHISKNSAAEIPECSPHGQMGMTN